MKHMVTKDFLRGRVSRLSKGKGKVEWETLKEDTSIDGIPFAAGSRFKRFESANFGYVVFDSESRTPEGWVPGRRIFRY